MSLVRQPAAALFMAVGLVWAFRSLQSFSDPRFSDPQNLNDWVAVLTLSVGMWLVALALLVLPRPAAGRWPARCAAVVGLANLVEDGFGVGEHALHVHLACGDGCDCGPQEMPGSGT